MLSLSSSVPDDFKNILIGKLVTFPENPSMWWVEKMFSKMHTVSQKKKKKKMVCYRNAIHLNAAGPLLSLKIDIYQ